MNRKRRMAGLIFILGLILGFGIWQQRSQAAGQNRQGVQHFASSATGNGLASPALRSATAAPMATVTVQSLGDGAADAANCPGVNCRLRDAIAKAADGDTINFAVNGTITLNSGELIISQSLTISGPGATQLTISGNNASRVFSIKFGLFNVTISGLTIANGRDKGGDASGGADNVGLASGAGGGILNYSQETVNVTNCTVVGNSAIGGSGNGSGVGGSFNRGQDGLGGGIYTALGTMNIVNSTLMNNSATGGSASGGGNSHNIARHGSGGGIYVAQGTVKLINSTLSGNSAIGGVATGNPGDSSQAGIASGGGIYGDGASTTHVINCTLSGNSAIGGSATGGVLAIGGQGSGGGIVGSIDLTITSSTLSGNSAIGGSAASSSGMGFAGGINIFSSTAKVRNTIIAGNTSNTSAPNVYGDLTSLGHNLIGNNSGATITPTTGDLIGTAAAPINPLLASLANYGGLTQTHALLPGSPALNAGNNCVLTNTCASDNLGFNLTTDQRGAGFNRQVGSTVDIGAFESRGFTLALASGNNQSALMSQAFASPLSVTVSSASGEPVNGGQVTFAPPESGPSATVAGNPATIAGGAATSGTVMANALIGGPYNVVASANGASSSVNFALNNGNKLPSIIAGAALTRQRGSAGTVSTIATVSSADTPVGSLIVTATTIPAGITVTSITNTAGTITANVAASCTAAIGTKTVVLTVTDGTAGTATANLTVNVTANTAPTLAYAAASVAGDAATTVIPATASDNGSITGYSIVSVVPPLTTAPTVNDSGLVSITNASPAGNHVITVRATDNCGATTDATFTLNVICPTITVNPSNPTLPVGRAGTPYSQSFTQTGGSGTIVWSVSTGTLPTGLSLNSGSGLLDGTPTVSGTFNFTIRATDVNGCSGERAYTLLLNQVCSTITVNPATLANGFQNTAYSQTLTATGGGSPYSFAVTTGSLPNGLTLASGGALTGMPTTAGTFNFTVTATDNTGCTGARSYTVIISGDGLVFYPLPRPVRILDTRAGAGNCDNIGTPITGGTSLTTLARLTCEGITIPATAKAITGNVTVINQTAQIGFLTIYPDGNSLPLAANMIYEPNGILSNNFTVGLSADGKFNIYGEKTLDAVVDVSGYYAPPGAGGLYYHPLPKPVRLLDTRAGQGTCDSVSTPITGGTSLTTLARVTCEGVTIPSSAQAIVGNATVINGSGQTGYLTIYPNGVTAPLAANIVYFPGQVLSNAFTVSLNASGEFNIFGERTIDMAVDVAGYYSSEATDVNGAGLLLTPLARPLRILDTRAGQGNCDAVSTPITGGSSIATAGRLTCESLTIPATAQSILGNVTVVNQTATAGFLTLYPDGVTQPLVANFIYFPNQILSNAFVVGLNSGTGQFRIFAERTLDAIVDVSGFFAP